MSARSHIIVCVSAALAIGIFNKRADERSNKFYQEMHELSALKTNFPKTYAERAKREETRSEKL